MQFADLLTKVCGLHDPYADLPVHRFMTPNPETVTPEDTLAFAGWHLNLRHCPIGWLLQG